MKRLLWLFVLALLMTCAQHAKAQPPAAGAIRSGQTQVQNATNGNCLYNNAGVLGNTPCGSGGITNCPGGVAGDVILYGTSATFVCDTNLTWDATNKELLYPFWEIVRLANASAPTVALVAMAGNVPAGDTYYSVTFVTSLGESSPINVSTKVTNDGGHGQNSLTSIPLGATGTLTRNIYRQDSSNSQLQLIDTLPDNTTTTYTDNIASGSGGPVYNSTGGWIYSNGNKAMLIGDPTSTVSSGFVMGNYASHYQSDIFGGLLNGVPADVVVYSKNIFPSPASSFDDVQLQSLFVADTNTTNLRYRGIEIDSTQSSGSGDMSALISIYSSSDWFGPGTLGYFSTFNAFPYISGPTTLVANLDSQLELQAIIPDAMGFRDAAQVFSGAALTNYASFNSDGSAASINAAATVTNFRGYWFVQPTTTTTTNLYGIQIGDVTQGTTLNYAIKTGVGLLSWGDKEQEATIAFASLPSTTRQMEYCSDCTVTSGTDNTCAGSGSGAHFEVINGVKKCWQ